MNINTAIDKAFNLGAFFYQIWKVLNKERKRAPYHSFSLEMEMEIDEQVVACAAIILASPLPKKKKRKSRKVWVKSWLINKDTKSAYNNILRELRLDDVENFRRYLRMNTETFDELVRRVAPLIENNCTRLRKISVYFAFFGYGRVVFQSTLPIPYIEVGNFNFRSRGLFSYIHGVKRRISCLFKRRKGVVGYLYEHLQVLTISECFGAMDGKHIAIFKIPGSGSLFYNYKGFFSVVLLALEKHNYQFFYVNVGCQGRISDGGVLKSSDLYHGIQSSSFNIPNPTPLPKTGDLCWDEDEYPDIPYMIVGDEAFQLANYMMKPYSTSRQLSDEQLVFNYRLSRFRRVSENAFGIFVSRFRTFISRINLKNL